MRESFHLIRSLAQAALAATSFCEKRIKTKMRPSKCDKKFNPTNAITSREMGKNKCKKELLLFPND
jgi:hypothetical protein